MLNEVCTNKPLGDYILKPTIHCTNTKQSFRVRSETYWPDLLRLFAGFVFIQVQEFHHSLAQELVEPHLSAVHDNDVQGAAFGVARVEQWQVERSLFFPHRGDTFLGHRGRKLVFGHLDDGVGVVGAMFALYAETPSLVHRYLYTRREPLLALVGQRHS